MKRWTPNNDWIGGNVESLTPDERKEKIRMLEVERLRIEEELADAVASYIKETGDTSLRIKKPKRNVFLLDSAVIGTEDLERRSVANRIYPPYGMPEDEED